MIGALSIPRSHPSPPAASNFGSLMSISVRTVSFSDEAGPSTSPISTHLASPSRTGRSAVSGASGRDGVIPLGAAKTVAALISRRGVVFSPSNDTKYFLQSDSILPLKTPPASIRAYPDPESSDPVCNSSPPPRLRPAHSSSSKSILKQRISQIRLAHSVEEGTLNNKEEARLVVSGKRPHLIARDSFQLAAMRTAAGEGLDKGKGRAPPDDNPGSDDSVISEDQPIAPSDTGSEVEEEVEASGPLATSSLIDIILSGAEDLLTLEEAYNVLIISLKARLPPGDILETMVEEIDLTLAPIRNAAPRLVCALQRDLRRLLGKVPNSEIPSEEADLSPFRGLMPLRESTRRFTPSPTPIPASKKISPSSEPTRKGYSESEVRYRRESAGVGVATLRFLAVLLSVRPLFSRFSQADLTTLLDTVMTIVRTPSLPTPNPKRTYYNALTVLANLKIPSACVLPVKEKIARSLESALTDGLGTPTSNSSVKDSTGQLRKEAFIAVTNMFNLYPSIFFAHFSELLAPCLRGLSASSPMVRNRAGAGVAAAASAKRAVLADTTSKENWKKNKLSAQRFEQFVISHLKSAVRAPSRSALVPSSGEKRTEWTELERMLKETVGTANEVFWACATWSLLVYLMGTSYASSGLASAFDHIMDRSLGPSTNSVRPLLARIAWDHAIHAYLSAGSMSSLIDETTITSYNPFPHSATSDWADRVKTLHLPFEHSMTLALDPASASRTIVDGQWTWQRVEKSKKLHWMVTTAKSAISVAYAFAGIALHHKEQPAKEISAISGLPSSDGVPESEADLEQATLGRLDKAWDRVIGPIVQKLWSIRGVDELKWDGCRILAAVLASSTDSRASWSLDKLISPEYLDGSAFGDETLDIGLLTSREAEEIPAFGAKWIIHRLDDLLDLFQDILTGIGGFSQVEGEWVQSAESRSLLPTLVSTVWSSLLRAIADAPKDSDGYRRSLWLITRHLVHIFNRDPVTYVPICERSIDGPRVHEPNALRVGVFEHLFDLTAHILGSAAIGSTWLEKREVADAMDNVTLDMAFGADATKGVTMAGCLLGQITRSAQLSLPLETTSAFLRIVSSLLDLGSTLASSSRLLGDMTNHMPFLFQEDETLQLAVWRRLALKWVQTIDTEPSTSSSTNHTGVLLVSLLSCPFRAGKITSAWHQHATTDDLASWRALLDVTVLRFKARQVGANFGVLQTLAGHLRDFLDRDSKTTSSTITLSCLAAAVTHLAFVAPEASDSDHFSINNNYLPVDFLSLVSDALSDSYPRPETLDGGSPTISTAVFELLVVVKQTILELPLEFVWPVISALKEGMIIWLMDEIKVVTDDNFAIMLDEVYMAVLAGLLEAMQAGHITADPGYMDSLLDLFGPRLSRAKSNKALEAFKEFYEGSFGHVHVDVMSEQLRSFMEDICAAVPGLITVPGLVVKDTFSVEESQTKYPYSESMRSISKPVEVLVDATEAEIVIELSGPVGDTAEEYDADVSQTQTQAATIIPPTTEKPSRQLRSALSTILSEGNLVSDPIVDDTEGDFVPIVEPVKEEPTGDVFGPTSQTVVKGKRGRKSRRRSSQTRPLGPAESQPEPKRSRVKVEADSSHSLPLAPATPLVPDSTDAVDESDDAEIDDCIYVSNSPIAPRRAEEPRDVIDLSKSPSPEPAPQTAHRPSFMASAKAYLSRVPTLWSPTTSMQSLGQAMDIDQTKAVQPPKAISLQQPPTQRRDRSRTTAGIAENSEESRSRESSTSANRRRQNKKKIRAMGKSASVEIVPKEETSGSPAQVIGASANDDEEDELLLSPESARKRRREEEGEIAWSPQRAVTPVPTKARTPSRRETRSRTRPATTSDESSKSGGPSGQFDDADESQQRANAVVETNGPPPSPMTRTARQVRMMRSLEMASREVESIANLDLEGVLAVMRQAEALRAAGQANLELRAIAERAAKRAKRRS